jgi:glutathione S-transferase
MSTNSQDTLEEIRHDLESTHEEYEKTKKKLEELEVELERLQNAYEVLREYLGGGPLADDKLSIADAAQIVLSDADGPLSVSEITERMLEGGFPYEKGRETLRRSVAGVLSRDKNQFERTERGVYRLRDAVGDDSSQEINMENEETPATG